MFQVLIFLPDLHQRFERIVAGFLLFSAALCIWALPTPPAHAAEVEISSGTLTSNSNAGTKWISVDFDALSTGDHELTVSWDNTSADLRINVIDDQTGSSIGNLAYTASEVVWTGALDVTGEYRVSIWVVSGGATFYEANLSDDVRQPDPPDPGTAVVIGTGILDSDKALGPRWVRIDFDALATTMHTITVSWDTPAADVRFRVREANGTALSPIINDATPGVWQGQLVQGESYYIALWSTDGSTNYTATLDDDDASVALAITTQPSDQSVPEGDDAVFTVVAAGGSGNYSYQWSADGTAIAGATADTLTLNNVVIADSGTEYSVTVSDDIGSMVSSAVATLDVLPDTGNSDVIGTGILDSEKVLGPRFVRIDFDALATTMHTITVSWDTPAADVRFRVREANGTPISPVINDPNPGVWQGQLVQGESYYIALWSTDGSTNYTATLDASVELAITTQPSDQTVTEGEDVTFNVIASGAGTLTYQWYADGAQIVGATNSDLTVVGVTLPESGTVFSVDVSNGSETISSVGATLTVEAVPALSITTQPNDQTVQEHLDSVFTVETSGGSGTVNYQWYVDNSVIGGATTDTLTVSAVTLGDTRTIYSVVVSDNNDTVISNDAMLTVVPDTSDVVAHWTMNEPAGASVMNDASGNGHHGTIGLDVVTGDSDMGATSYRWLFTPPTQSYEPERIINAPHNSDFNPGTGNYSITMTYRTSVPFGNIMQKGQGGAAGGYWKIENPAGILTCVFRGVAPSGGWNRKEVVSSVPLNDGQYHTITCERIGTQLRLIVDGVLDDTANNSIGSISNTRPISIGGKTNCDNVNTSCDYFTGWIDDIMISIPD